MHDKPLRKNKPHVAIITFRIDVRPVNPDNTLSPHILQNGDLKKYGLGSKGQIVVRGTSEADCASKVNKILEKLND